MRRKISPSMVHDWQGHFETPEGVTFQKGKQRVGQSFHIKVISFRSSLPLTRLPQCVAV